MGNGPVFKDREKGFELVIWDNPTGYSINIKKSYKDKFSGEWKESTKYFEGDIPILSRILERANTWLINNVHASTEDRHIKAAAREEQNTYMPDSKIDESNQSFTDFDDDDIPF